MAFCTNCGAQVADGTAFCPTCGKAVAGAQPAAAAPPPAAPGYTPAPAPAAGAPAQSPTAGLQENVAGLLCYVLGWITGLIFLFVDKRPFVRFHAAQSIVVFGALTIIYIIIGQFFVASYVAGGWAFYSMIYLLLRLAGLVLWILLMVKAYQGQRYKLPLAGDFAESLAGKVQ
jgi:uncharacterized membrane protein